MVVVSILRIVNGTLLDVDVVSSDEPDICISDSGDLCSVIVLYSLSSEIAF